MTQAVNFSRSTFAMKWPLFLFLSVFFVTLSQERLIAKDEGFYVIASKLVAQGQSPYLDFFYPQMPLLPYVYALAVKLLGATWESLRAVSGLFAALMGTMVFIIAYKQARFVGGIVAALIFVTCNFVFPWHLTVQTYALSTILLLGAYFLLEESCSKLGTLLAGLLFGLSISSRLFFAGLFPIFVLIIIRIQSDWSKSFTHFLWFCCGILFGLLPALYFIVQDLDLFYFNNLGYHLHRTGLSPDQIWQNKLRILHVVFGFHDSVKFEAPHLAILLWVSIIGSLVQRLMGIRIHNSLFIAAGLFFLNLVPAPAYVQYFCTLVPFLICTFIYVGANFIAMIPSPQSKSGITFSICCLILSYLYFAGSYEDFRRYTRTGEGVIGIRTQENARYWDLENASRVANMIDRNIPSEKQVVSIWPGYLLESHVDPFPGLENHFASRIAPQISVKQRPVYKVVTLKQVAETILSPNETFVLDNERASKRNLRQAIKSRGCRLLEKERIFHLYHCEAQNG